MDKYTFISNATPEYLEKLYYDFKRDSTSVDGEFRKFFEGFDFATLHYGGKGGGVSADEFKVYKLIDAYRKRGHYRANTNPIRPRKDRNPELDLADFGLTEADLEKPFAIGAEIGLANATLSGILAKLQRIYCGTIGFEYGYVRKQEEVAFFREKLEQGDALFRYAVEKKEHILRKLNQAVIFEKFLGTKYMGEKRFSLEGGETTIPGFDAIIETAASLQVEEVVIGMAHRGRLNVLANIMGKTYEEIFNEFEGNAAFDLTMGDGDVKYHLGFSHQYPTKNGKSVYLKLMPNPSHLEAVNPVVEGFVRAKADAIYGSDYDKILPILVHGDAAVAGQGIVYEVLQMMTLKGYETGGTIHFVINNQIGFTTSFDDARSSDYCSSIAATVEAPVLHVNGDDIEAVVYACELAVEYRQKFNKDIFIDMVCYRRWGHNESDEPKFTQPGMYKLIEKHANPRDVYTAQLEQEGAITAEMSKRLEKEFWSDLQQRLDAVKQKPLPYKPQPTEVAWQRLRMANGKDFDLSPVTAISKKAVDQLITALTTYPEGFQPLRQVLKHLEDRKKLMVDNQVIDWAAAELMAYGSILLEGKNVRLSGEDVKRGTFTHRHAVITDQNTDQEYNRLSALSKDQGKFFIYNSHLSEYGVLGFEYGYAITHPDALVLWEAQFGDFSNGAQIIIDQFIAAGESKWQRKCGLVMLLPHGYEGQGPEHSSARLERFLQLCSELNMVVVNITDPANYFHALRRQLAWEFRKPLVVMSPKSLLRLPACQSPLAAVMEGGFKELIDDAAISKTGAAKVRRVLLCSGKIYFDLLDRKNKDQVTDIAIVRLEQLYPIPEKGLMALKEKYSKAEFVWVQEEPQNMGAWNFLLGRLYEKLSMKVIARKNSASPATGFKKQHVKEQAELLDKAFGAPLKT
ncbi:MAG: 2-oxoglutarate dehydrogenase E1 component [Chitinophagales bacterium]